MSRPKKLSIFQRKMFSIQSIWLKLGTNLCIRPGSQALVNRLTYSYSLTEFVFPRGFPMATVVIVACGSVCIFCESVSSVKVRISHIVTIWSNGKCTAFKDRQIALVLMLALALPLIV